METISYDDNSWSNQLKVKKIKKDERQRIRSQWLLNFLHLFQAFRVDHFLLLQNFLETEVDRVSSDQALVGKIAQHDFRQFLGFLEIVFDFHLCLLVAVLLFFLIRTVFWEASFFNFLRGFVELFFEFLVDLFLTVEISSHDNSPVGVDVAEEIGRDAKSFHFLEHFVKSWWVWSLWGDFALIEDFFGLFGVGMGSWGHLQLIIKDL